MATATPGTFPSFPPYQPGALQYTGSEIMLLVTSATATAAATYYDLFTNVVGKTIGVMTAANPSANDMLAFYQVSSGLPKACSIGNLGVPSGNMPSGGTQGQMLAKNSATNFDASWFAVNTFVAADGVTLATSGSATSIVIAVATGGIGSAQIGALAVGSTQLATFAVGSTQLATAAVGSTQFRQSAGLSVVGNAGTASAQVVDITAAQTSGLVLQVASTGTSLVFGAITTALLPGPFQVSNFSANGVIIGNGTSALAASGAGTAGMVFVGNGTAIAPSFQQISLASTSTVTGTLTVSYGGSGTTTFTADGVLYGNGTSALGVTAAGTTGYVLAGAGTATPPAFVGGLTLITTLLPSTIGSVTVTGISAAYSRYRITFDNLAPSTTTAIMQMTIATTGTTFLAANYVSVLAVTCNGTMEVETYTSAILLTGQRATTQIQNSTSYGLFGFLELENPSSGNYRHQIVGSLSYLTAGASGTATVAGASVLGYYDGSSNAIVALNFAMNTSTIATGIIKLWGYL